MIALKWCNRFDFVAPFRREHLLTNQTTKGKYMSDTNALLTLIAQAAGVDETQLTALLGQVSQATESAPKADMNPGDVAHELALQKGYVPAKGRVYLTKAVIEAASQTEVDAQPRIVDLNDNRALVMFKTKSGDVAAQNYYKRSR